MKLTKLFKTGLIALVCGAFSASTTRAALTYTQGDLLMAFRETGSNQTYMVDLGSATSFRDATSMMTLGTSGIAADLSATFGPNWYTNSNVYASIVGGNNTSTALPGDGTSVAPPYYSKSVYVSASGTGSSSDTAFSNISQSTVAAMATSIGATFGGVYAGGTATGNDSVGTLISTSTSNNYTALVPAGGAANYFGGLTTSTEVNPNGTFDLYRILANTTGATAAPSGNGVSQYQGAFTLSSAGVVTFTPEVTAAPEPSRVILLGLGLTSLLMRRRRKA